MQKDTVIENVQHLNTILIYSKKKTRKHKI